MMRGGMRRLPAGRDLQFDAALMPAVYLHFGRLTDDHEIRFDFGIHFDKCVGSYAVAPFLHISKVIDSPAVEQIQITRDGKPVDHSGRRTLLIARAARI